MRGAAYLAGLDEPDSEHNNDRLTVVVDIGGTTTDVGVLLPSGFPRQAGAFIEIAGVRTNFSMADVQSIALGGGSRITISGDSNDPQVTVGPTSLGNRLLKDGMIFGGEVLTATGIAVAGGLADVGNAELVQSVPESVVAKAKNAISRALEKIIDR